MYLPYHGHPHVMDFILIRKVEVLVKKGFDCNTLLNEAGTHLRYQDGGFSVAEHLNFPDHNKIHDMRVSLVKYTALEEAAQFLLCFLVSLPQTQ